MSLFADYHNFVVIIGWDKFSDLVVEQLVSTKRQIIALVDDEQTAERINSTYDNRQVIALKVDYFNLQKLNKLPLERAFGAYINLASDRDRLIYIFKLRKAFPELSIISPILNPKLKESFASHRKIFPLSRDVISAKIFASHLFKRDVANFLNQLLTPSVDENDHELRQYLVLPENPFCSEMYGDAFIKLKKDFNTVLVGISKLHAQGGYQLRKNPTDETLIQKGDYLIVLVNGKSAKELEKIFGVGEGS